MSALSCLSRRVIPSMTDEDFMSHRVEVPVETKRKRRKYRRYPKPVGTADQKKALWEH
jgi:hypothetical protein